MIPTRTILILVIVLGTPISPATSFAVADEPENGRFTWLKFKEKDGSDCEYPRWKSHPKKEFFVLLDRVKAEYILSEDYKLEKAELRIYKANPFIRNAFNVEPAITCTAPLADVKATLAGPDKIAGHDTLKKWTITWFDSTMNPTSLPGGIDVKLEVTIAAKKDGKDVGGVLPSTTTRAEVR